jgi:uncharacterized membrane protein
MVAPERRLGPLPGGRDAYGRVIHIALPAIAEMVLMSLIGSLDTIMVGQLGKNALAAVSLPAQPRMIMLALFFALNVGVTAIVARRKGQGRQEDANLTLRNALVLCFGLSVVVAGLATGLVAGMTPMEILTTLGNSFLTNRTATLFVLTLPVIGILERYGLKDKAVDFIRGIKHATTGKILSLYLVIRAFAAAFSLRIGGHPQFVRPLINPMAAANENFGNFFAQNCFMGASGTLLIVSTLNEQGLTDVNALNISGASWYIFGAAVILGVMYNYLLDRRQERVLKGGK